MPHFNVPRLPLSCYPRWNAHTLYAWRAALEPSEDFTIAFVVLASDPTRADATISSSWMVFRVLSF